MLFDTKTEELWIKYLNPKETIFPAEIHELARGLLDAYRKITLDKGDLNDEPTLSGG